MGEKEKKESFPIEKLLMLIKHHSCFVVPIRNFLFLPLSPGTLMLDSFHGGGKAEKDMKLSLLDLAYFSFVVQAILMHL